jgi:hypothetical protein
MTLQRFTIFLSLFFLTCAGIVPASAQTVFTPLLKAFVWTPATSGVTGPFPVGEVESGATLGIRADGDTGFSAGHYKYLIVVPPTQASETPSAIGTALGSPLVAGNYWAAIDQTEMYNGVPSTSAWSAEIAFSIPASGPMKPLAPINFSAN